MDMSGKRRKILCACEECKSWIEGERRYCADVRGGIFQGLT